MKLPGDQCRCGHDRVNHAADGSPGGPCHLCDCPRFDDDPDGPTPEATP